MIIFSVLLYFKSKKDRQTLLDEGICPLCDAKAKTFNDKNTNTTFKVDVITKRLLKNHGCSGIIEYEYNCSSCGLKEVHNTVGQSCSI
jgi:hypothetical protein